MSKVFITGGAGFIGSHVVRAFVVDGIRVGCLVRRGSNHTNLQGLPVDMVYGDLRDGPGLIKNIQGYDAVVHIGGYARDWGVYRDFYETNVTGTLNLLHACRENGIGKIIITASNSVYGEEHCLIPKNEESPLHSHYPYFLNRIFPSRLNDYRDTKALGKKEAMKFARENGMNLIIIEPVWVYGEREFHTGFYEYLATAATGIPFLPGSKKNKFHVVYAGDLARAYLLAYHRNLTGIHSFLIGNDTAEPMDRIYQLFCREAGFHKPRNLPKWLVYPVGFFLELVYTLVRAKNPPLLTRGRVNMFYDNIEYSTARAKEVLGFRPVTPLEEGVRKTVQWYREEGLI